MKLAPFPFETIIEWQQENGRHSLPWRQFFDVQKHEIAYHIWVSEIMLQQTQVSRVVDYYNRFIEKYPTIWDLAIATWDEFFPCYQWLGYYSRGRNMIKCAQSIVSDHGWVFPNDYQLLTDLSGIGPYTANAILSFAYQKPVLSIDTNLQKIFARYYYGDRKYKLSKQEIQEIQAQFEKSRLSSRVLNGALMDFASQVSINSVKKIEWDSYPLSDCNFFQEQGKKEIQREENKVVSRFPTREAKICLILHKDHKTYYSPDFDNYQGFILDPIPTGDIRHAIQKQFQNTYNITLSVRPPHKKCNIQGQPFVFIHAQVQAGENSFAEFWKKEKENWLQTLLLS